MRSDVGVVLAHCSSLSRSLGTGFARSGPGYQPEVSATDTSTSELFGDPLRWRQVVVGLLGLEGEERCAGASTSIAMPQLIDGFAERLSNEPAGMALDVGGGLGPASSWLEERTGHRFTTLDCSSEACSGARRLFGVPSGQAMSCDLPIAAASCSAVLLNGIASLLDDLVPTIREAARVTRPGGLIAIADLTATGDQRVTTHTNTFWTTEELWAHLTEAGCHITYIACCETHVGRWVDVQALVRDEIATRYADQTGFDEWQRDNERLDSVIRDGNVAGTTIIARRDTART